MLIEAQISVMVYCAQTFTYTLLARWDVKFHWMKHIICFITQVTDLMDYIGFFIQATSSYFKSSEPSLRKAAALLIGNLFSSK